MLKKLAVYIPIALLASIITLGASSCLPLIVGGGGQLQGVAAQRDDVAEVRLEIEGPFRIYVNGVLVEPSEDSTAEPTVGATRELTATVPASTPTVTTEPTSEPEPTAEATPTVTPEPTAEATPTAPAPDEHNTSLWHPPADGHHHGADPATVHPDIAFFLANYPEYASIGHPWLSSPIENVFAPHGKHVGFKNLVESGLPCVNGRGEPIDPCVTDYYYQVHSTGTANESRVRIHSHKGVFRVCNFEQTQCDIVATGGHADFGQMHSQYKQTVCPLPNGVILPEPYHGDQPPYTAISGTRPNSFIFWNSLHNPVTFQFYNPVPNRILQAAWSERGWSVPAAGEGPECLTIDVLTGRNATRFQVFTFRLIIDKLPRPFVGFTDVFGAVDESCTETGPNCVPLYIGASVPGGTPLLSRVVGMGDPDDAPILNFDNGHPFVMPVHN